MVYTVRDIHTLGVKMSSKINWLVAHTSPGELLVGSKVRAERLAEEA